MGVLRILLRAGGLGSEISDETTGGAVTGGARIAAAAFGGGTVDVTETFLVFGAAGFTSVNVIVGLGCSRCRLLFRAVCALGANDALVVMNEGDAGGGVKSIIVLPLFIRYGG